MAQLGDSHYPFRSNASTIYDVGATIDPGIPAQLTDAEIDQLWNELFGTPDPIIAQAEENVVHGAEGRPPMEWSNSP